MSRDAAIKARWGALSLTLLAGWCAAAVLMPGTVAGQAGGGGVTPLPTLGAADVEMALMGAASAGAPGEAWGYRALPPSVGAVRRNGQQLQFGAPPNPAFPEPQLAFLRHTDATGWQVYETPLDEQGQPYRGPAGNRLSARTTAHGGGVLVGRDNSRAVGDQVVVLHRNPGGRFRALEPPPDTVLLAGEELAGDRGLGRVAVAAVEEGQRTGLLIAPVGPAAEGAVLHFDGETWTREPVAVPAGSESDFQLLAIAAIDGDNAWALAHTDPALGRGLVLLERVDGPSGKQWVERTLDNPLFEANATPAQGVSELAPLGGAAQPLTATDDGVWIDGTLTTTAGRRDFTVFFDPGAGQIAHSWCDDPVCDDPLGAALSQTGGYRSFAWTGPAFGTRVITNPLDPGGGEDTNRGTYLRLEGTTFRRMAGAGGNFRPGGAFRTADDGWLEGPVRIAAATPPARLRAWPVALRAPLADVAPQPSAAPGSLGSRALAVGLDGGIARYLPGRGWQREFLFTSSGSVSKAALRGVAWPEPNRAHAVGDLGALWQWNADNGLWEPDPGAPVGFEGNLLDVAFQPGNPERGYAVGKGGVVLRYGKSWEPDPLPGPFATRGVTQVAFAGSQAIAAAGSALLTNDGSGWREDRGVKQLLDGVRGGSPQLVAVAGLPDGGAVAAGRDIVLERPGRGQPWRFADQPLPGSTVVAIAAYRSAGRLRSVVSVVPRLAYPPQETLPPSDPNVPPPIVPPNPLPGDGYVLRQTDAGWVDEQRSAFSGSGADRPIKPDPILAFALDSAGNGWAVGGWSGDADAAGRGSSARNAAGRETRARVRTAGIYRYGSGATPPPTSAVARVRLAGGRVRLAVAGHAQCELPCADLRAQSIGPDRTLAAALARAAALHGGAGPRAFLYTGGRQRVALGAADAGRYAELLGGQPTMPVFPALAAADAAGGALAFRSAFAGFPAPLGDSVAPAGISTAGIPGAGATGGRTHYAFDTSGPGGRLRVVVIDNSLGSLAASDAHQNPPEAQRPWLITVLADARAEGVPVVVMGSRDLNTRFQPRLNVAADGDDVARLLVQGGASAYVYDRPEENRALRIPAASADSIPAFASGTLGYRSPIVGRANSTAADSLFGDSGFLLLEIDVAHRDPATNRAPARARLVPVIEDLSLEGVDGTLLRRSRPALFRGLGRRPRAGDRWGRIAAGDGNPNPPGGDPYTTFPPTQCTIPGCSARIAPEYEFVSSDPDIADFVRQDPNSTNLRKPLIDAADKVVSDSSSGLLCPFNAGTTTVTVRAGNFSAAQRIIVQQGSVQRPCGTRPLRPDRFRRARPNAAAPPPAPPPAPAGSPPISFQPPPPPLLTSPPITMPGALPLPPIAAALPPVLAPELAGIIAVPPPPPPPAVRPTPPGGVGARVYQVEEKREEEAAIEESQAFSRYEPREDGGFPPYVLGLVLIAAVAGATVRGRPGARDRRARPASVTTASNHRPPRQGGPRP